jgi:hypothetical protein
MDINVIDIMQIHFSQFEYDEKVSENFDVNSTEMVNRNKRLIVGDFSAQVGNDVILVGQVKW